MVLVLAVVVVGIAAILLGRTLVVAHSISDKAANISTTGRGINTSTDSVIQLQRTNQSAASILESTKPLQGALNVIVTDAGDINNLAGSINSSAGAINGVAKGINSSAGAIKTSAVTISGNAGGILKSANSINPLARSINKKAADILDTAKLVDRDAKDINDALDDTIDIAKKIKGDASDIRRQAGRILVTSSCIAQKVRVLGLIGAPPPPTNDCQQGRS